MSKETGKPFIVNETFPGALDDLVRAEVVHFYSEMLSAAGFGWMGGHPRGPGHRHEARTA